VRLHRQHFRSTVAFVEGNLLGKQIMKNTPSKPIFIPSSS